MTQVVMKFGGTSVKDPARLRAVAHHIAHRRKNGVRVVAVISAMGATTDDLLALAAELSDRPPPRELDLLLATGESAAASLLCIALEALGVPARSFTGSAAGIVTTGAFGRGRISEINPTALTTALDAGLVPVVAGFQGSRSDGEVTTLGRGGSDTSAVALAAALGLPCEIYTDVPGVFAADPRLVSDAQPHSILSHETLACMSANGSSVVARRAVELASVHNVPLQVRSSFTWQSGTGVTSDQPPLETCSVLAVSHDTSAALVNVEGIRSDPTTLAVMLTALGRAQIPLTIVPRARIDDRAAVVGLVINRDDLDATVETLEPVAHSLGGRVVSKTGLSLVSVVGIGLTSYADIPGTAAAAVGCISPAAELLIASPSVITWLVPTVVAHDVVRRMCDVLALRSTSMTHHTEAAAG